MGTRLLLVLLLFSFHLNLYGFAKRSPKVKYSEASGKYRADAPCNYMYAGLTEESKLVEEYSLSQEIQITIKKNNIIFVGGLDEYEADFSVSKDGSTIILTWGNFDEGSGDWLGGGKLLIEKKKVTLHMIDGAHQECITEYEKMK